MTLFTYQLKSPLSIIVSMCLNLWLIFYSHCAIYIYLFIMTPLETTLNEDFIFVASSVQVFRIFPNVSINLYLNFRSMYYRQSKKFNINYCSFCRIHLHRRYVFITVFVRSAVKLTYKSASTCITLHKIFSIFIFVLDITTVVSVMWIEVNKI